MRCVTRSIHASTTRPRREPDPRARVATAADADLHGLRRSARRESERAHNRKRGTGGEQGSTGDPPCHRGSRQGSPGTDLPDRSAGRSAAVYPGACGADSHLREWQAHRETLPRHHRKGPERRRARLSERSLPSALLDERISLRSLHGPEGRHEDRALHRFVRQQCRRPCVVETDPVDRPALLEPSGRPQPLRS